MNLGNSLTTNYNKTNFALNPMVNYLVFIFQHVIQWNCYPSDFKLPSNTGTKSESEII